MSATSVSVGPQRVKPVNSLAASFLVWCLPALIIVVALASLRAPSPVPASAPAQDFSAERAVHHVRAIAQAPHPIGSNEGVRRYLIKQLVDLGTNPQVISAVGISHYGPAIAAGNTENVLASLPGAASSGAVFLVAHYDSVSTGQGAADDGAGVAAILETIRALRAGPPLKNDIDILFTDGEEPGLLGAEALSATASSLIPKPALVLNFEARGSHGPSLLFETSTGNHGLMDEVTKGAAYPVASSLFYTLYETLPNKTDFSIFRKSSTPGLNFAFGSGFESYHSRLDTPENLSLASLQHHGSYALALSRHFGQMDLSRLNQKNDNAVFFNWLGANLVVYGERWIIPGHVLLTVIVALTFFLALKQKRVTTAKVFLAALAIPVFLVIVPAVLATAWWIISALFGGRLVPMDSPGNSLLLAGLVLLAAMVASWLMTALLGRFSLESLWLAGVGVLTVLSWAIALLVPSGSYLLFWPVFIAALGILVVQLLKIPAQPVTQFLTALPGFVAGLLLFAPLVYLVYVFISLQLATIIATGFLVAASFLIGFPIMALAAKPEQPRWEARLLVPIAVAVCLAAGVAISRPGPSHPRYDEVLYSINVNDHAAKWISFDQAPDNWSAQFFPGKSGSRQVVSDYVAGEIEPAMISPAEMVSLPVPEGQILSDEKNGDVHKLSLNVQSHRDADVVHVVFAKGLHCVAAVVAGRTVPFQQESDGLHVMLYGMSKQTVKLTLTLKAPGTISFWVMDQSVGLPFSPRPRPADLAPWPGATDATLVSRKYTQEAPLTAKESQGPSAR